MASNGGMSGDYYDQDVEMKPEEEHDDSSYSTTKEQAGDEAMSSHAATGFRRNSHLSSVEDVVPRIITSSHLSASIVTRCPSVSSRVFVSSRNTDPSATRVTNGAQPSPSNDAPGCVKAECSNCGATHTPLWRRQYHRDSSLAQG